jgi:hypothetical protein
LFEAAHIVDDDRPDVTNGAAGEREGFVFRTAPLDKRGARPDMLRLEVYARARTTDQEVGATQHRTGDTHHAFDKRQKSRSVIQIVAHNRTEHRLGERRPH